MKAVISTVFGTELMKSEKHAALHEIFGVPMIDYVVNSACAAGFEPVIVNDAEDIGKFISRISSEDEESHIIIAGNAPLIESGTISKLALFHQENKNHISVLSHNLNLSSAESAIFAVNNRYLCNALLMLEEKDTLPIAFGSQSVMLIKDISETVRVWNRVGLAEVTAVMRERINGYHMKNGVTLIDPLRTDISADVIIGSDTVIYPGCLLESGTKIGKNCIIGSQCRIYNSEVADGVEISYSVILESSIGKATEIGPFAYVRPNSVIGEECKIGDFVEVKNSYIGDRTKASHLTYIGDSDVGSNVNFGCGTVTVNFDGKNKYRTKVGDRAFIGCNTNLVAPVEIGENAYTAAGSTIVDNVPSDSLAIARMRQINKPDWVKKQNK